MGDSALHQALWSRQGIDGRRARTLWWAAVVVTVLVPVLGLLVTGWVPSDLRVYRRAGADVLAADDLYRSGWTGLPFTYPPFAALAFVPLPLMPPPAMTALWTAVSGVLLARTVWLLAGGITPRPGGRAAYGLAAALLVGAAVSEPVLRTHLLGQINVVVAWLLVEDWLGRGRGRWCGTLTGVAIGLKLTPAIVPALVLLAGRRRPVVVSVGAALATAAVGWFLLPRSSQDFWGGGVIAPGRVGGVEYVGNQSLDGVLWRLAGRGGLPVLWAVLAAVAVLLGAVVVRRCRRRGHEAGMLLGALLVGWLVSPISWSHHWLLLVPLLAWAWQVGDRRVRLAAVALAPWAFGWLEWLTPHDHGLELGHTWGQALLADAQPVLGLVLLGTLALPGAMPWRDSPGRSLSFTSREPADVMVLT